MNGQKNQRPQHVTRGLRLAAMWLAVNGQKNLIASIAGAIVPPPQ